MTIYICQVPHRGDAHCWTSESDERAISLIQDEFHNADPFESLHEAIVYDKATALAASDPFDLFAQFYWGTLLPRTDAAMRAIVHAFRGEAEDELADDPTNDDRQTAFNGSFIYDHEERCQILGNDRIEGDVVRLLFEHYAKTQVETRHVDI